MSDLAIELLNELLNGGNSAVADHLHAWLVHKDTEGKFVGHLERRLQRSGEHIRDAKKRGFFGVGLAVESTAEFMSTCEECIQTVRCLQLLCEGHRWAYQELLREQPMYRSSANLVAQSVELLAAVCESSACVGRFCAVELDTVAQLLAFLTEAMQGPCAGNQDLVASSEAIVAVNNIMLAACPCDARLAEADPSHASIRTQAAVMAAACLEGRGDFATHELLQKRLDMKPLLAYQTEIEVEVRSIRAAAAEENRLLTDDEENRCENALAALVAIVTVKVELRMMQEAHDKADDDNGEDGGDAQGADSTAKSTLKRDLAGKGAVEPLEPLVGMVEVQWKGKIERVVFPLPPEHKYLCAATKAQFLLTVDLATAEKRMGELLRCCDDFAAEMEHVHALAETSAPFRFLSRNLPAVKLGVYACVLVLNANVAASDRKHRVPWASLASLLDGSSAADTSLREAAALGVTFALGALVLGGYSVVSMHLAQLEVPLMLRKMDEEVADALEHDPKGESRTRPQALNASKGFLVATLVVGAIHYLNFAPQYGWYLALLCFQLPVLASSLRAYTALPATPTQRHLCLVYDIILGQPFLRNHVVLALFCVLGFNQPQYFTLMLLDIINISPVIGDIMKSVTAPAGALGWVFYLYVITTVIYAAWGMEYFSDIMLIPTALVDDDDGNSTLTDDDGARRFLKAKAKSSSSAAAGLECKSVFDCAAFLFYGGLQEGGNAKAILQPNEPGRYSYLPRIVFDSVFFIWVGIVLVNVITGLMVDTFSSIREENATREETLETDCFVCGLQRSAYEDLGLAPGSASFEAHLKEDHDLWTYVWFLTYLKKKDPTEFNGVESFVMAQVNKSSLEFLPSRNSFAIQDQGKGGASGSAETAAAVTAAAASESAATLATQMDKILSQLATLATAVEEMQAQGKD
jgi:hypothetical protein